MIPVDETAIRLIAGLGNPGRSTPQRGTTSDLWSSISWRAVRIGLGKIGEMGRTLAANVELCFWSNL
jgi:hypothetical protein